MASPARAEAQGASLTLRAPGSPRRAAEHCRQSSAAGTAVDSSDGRHDGRWKPRCGAGASGRSRSAVASGAGRSSAGTESDLATATTSRGAGSPATCRGSADSTRAARSRSAAPPVVPPVDGFVCLSVVMGGATYVVTEQAHPGRRSCHGGLCDATRAQERGSGHRQHSRRGGGEGPESRTPARRDRGTVVSTAGAPSTASGPQDGAIRCGCQSHARRSPPPALSTSTQEMASRSAADGGHRKSAASPSAAWSCAREAGPGLTPSHAWRAGRRGRGRCRRRAARQIAGHFLHLVAHLLFQLLS